MFFRIVFFIFFTTVITAKAVDIPRSYGQKDEVADLVRTDTAKALLNSFHHELEGYENENAQNFLSEWAEKFNFLKISLNTHRWIQMKYITEKDHNEYVQNLPVMGGMYLLSHSLEMMSGPVGVYLASDLGLPYSAQVLIGTVGAIISVPGLDPVCILFFAISPTKPVQKFMTGVRVFAVKVSGIVSDKTHLQKILNSFMSKKDRLKEILGNFSEESQFSSRYAFDVENDVLTTEVSLKGKKGEPYLILSFKNSKDKNNEGITWVEALQILDRKELNTHKEMVLQFFKKFNLSSEYALREAIKKPTKTFYIQQINTENHMTNILFKDYALIVKPLIKFQLKSQQEGLSCKVLFN